MERLLGREVELEIFLNHYAVDTCLLSETFLNPIVSAAAQANSWWRFIRTDPPYNSPPLSAVPGLPHLQAPADKPVKILAAYLSPSNIRIGANFSACLCRWLPVLFVGNLNAKHVDGNSWLSTTGKISYVIMLLEMTQKGRHTACQNMIRK